MQRENFTVVSIRALNSTNFQSLKKPSMLQKPYCTIMDGKIVNAILVFLG